MKPHLLQLRRPLGRAALLVALAAPAFAQAAMSDSATLYDQLGGKPAITQLVHDMLVNVQADNRISHYFAKTDIAHLQMQIVNQVCEVSGGPCHYAGPNMQQAHAGMHLSTADFNALVEDLQQSMNTHHVPLGVQNQLLAVLAPMEPDVVHK